MKTLIKITMTCALLIAASACSSDDSEVRSFDLGLTNLPELGSDFVYEGWLITPDGPVSTGRFADGESSAFEVDGETVDAASKFVLTIEPAVGDDPAPADVHLLAGDFDGVGAMLSTSDPAAIATDFAAADGDFILTTPTTASIDSDAVQGIWWLIPGATKQPSLSLPELPAGWMYEGWVVGDNGPISTGRFLTPEGADSDGAGATAGPDGSPPFPGQDFIDPALSLVGLTAVITVEPEPDTSLGPFALKPLITATISDVAAPTLQVMANESIATLPTGWVALK